LVRLLEDAAVVGVAAGPHPAGHRLDGAVNDLAARGSVETGPAVAQRGEAIPVHPISSASSLSCAYVSSPAASSSVTQRSSSTSSLGANSPLTGSISQ